MPRKIVLLACGFVCLVLLLPMFAQQKTGNPLPIEQAIAAKEYKKAEGLLQKETAQFISTGNLDTLIFYIPLAGEIANELYGPDKAVAAVFAITDQLKKEKTTPTLLVAAYRTAADFFSGIGQNQGGYDASKEALTYMMLKSDRTEADVARCEYNLGIYAHRLGNVALSLKHHRRAMDLREANSNTNPEDIYLSANAMGSLMWYASKYDSATLLYNKALEALKKMPDNDVNKYFRPGNIQNNLAALYSAEGKTTEAIKAMQSTIDNFRHFIASKEPGNEGRKQSATEGLYESIDNLAGIYKEVGDYGKAGQLLQYSYQQKKQKLDPAHPGIFISEILLGQYYHAIHEYDTAMFYLQQGLDKLEKASGDYLFWAADGYYTKAMIYENRKDNSQAAASYAKSEGLYEASYEGQYDNVYMDFLRTASLFYAKNGDYPKAFERADKVYKYLVNVNESNSLEAFYQLLNIAEINYLTKRYKEAISWCNNALKVVKTKMKDGATLLDSVKIEALKPKAILINAKAAYELQEKKDSGFLKGLSAKLDEALNIMEKRKTVIDDETSINILISDHNELIDFAKKIELQLAKLTGNSFHIDKLINLQESALYNRIRGRLDKQQAILFSGIPSALQQQEHDFKKAITASLLSEKPDSELINDYISSTHRWETHLDKIKNEYPGYYSMRYATIFKSLPALQSSLPDSSTIIRYFFADTSLMALVLDRDGRKLVTVKSNDLENKINTLLLNQSSEKIQLPILHELYQMLWEPIAALVRHKKVIIIPDGILYNLNFEMLATQPLMNYKALAANSLLSKNIISYHYSLFMLNQGKANIAIKENYVAFAPGFSDEVKKKYLSLAKDSATLDYHYLRLLPQPATHKLARKMGGLFSGNTFLNEASTRNSFQKNAGGHKIIHIGTHASFNNIRPEQSGLIFAKNAAPTADNNFLSLYDIYSCDMQSELTILTACESGRPGYQDGEGMVSLAHAFNYAGSQRILTALWKIDEQSSNLITEFFINNLKSGYLTDEALQQAKLQYLQKAEGRILAPAYWAGLVMIGEPTQLSFHTSANNTTYWIIAGALVLTFLFFCLIRYRK